MVLMVPMMFGVFFSTFANAFDKTNYIKEPSAQTEFQIDKGGSNPLDDGKKTDFSQIDNSDRVEINEYVFKTYDDYFIDYGIPTKIADISKTTITGDGSENSPYQINSTEDFIFFSKVGFRNKHLELNCDIILNEEIFDENGVPSGGDGVYYDWAPIRLASGASLDGKGHTIHGLHMTNAVGHGRGTYIGMIGIHEKVTEIKNVNIKNVYIKGEDHVAAIAIFVEKIENCHLLSGTMKSSNYISGLVCTVNNEIINCSNYATICGNFGVSGVANTINAIADRCVNYGQIIGEGSNYIAGVFQDARGIIRNCINYGQVNSEGSFGVGGLIANSNYALIIENSVNYGSVTSLAGNPSGFVGVVRTDEPISFVNCKQYGICINDKGGVGYHLTKRYMQDLFNVNVINCDFYNTSNNMSIIEVKDSKIRISNCKIFYENVNSQLGLFLGDEMDIEVNGLEIVANFVEGGSLYIFGNFNNKPSTYAEIKNVHFKFSGQQTQNSYIGKVANSYWYPQEWLINGLIVTNLTSGSNHYYGSNFDNFYYNYKTGQIGLASLNWMGTTQTRLTEDMLNNRGYTKIEY